MLVHSHFRFTWLILLAATVTLGALPGFARQAAVPASSSAAEKQSASLNPDYSKEAVVYQKLEKEVRFEADGRWTAREVGAIRVQSEAGLQQLSVLSFSYNHDNQEIKFGYIRVRKPDGSVVVTPADNAQDISEDVTRSAPMYSDLRQKQIPIKSLNLGDVLEYEVRFEQKTPEIPGQFWYSQPFEANAVVLEQTLTVSVPLGKYVNVSSPSLKPTETENAGRRTYLWKRSQLVPTSQDESSKANTKPHTGRQPGVELTTFRSWDELGRWYGDLQKDRAAPTPPIRAKADELTKGLTTETDKEKALYDFVSTQIRYVSLSFGVGRYQPHAAAEVLGNGYGDCKDKHTLLAALLKAEGIDAWPALIGAGIEFDDALPYPAQFNHVITYLPSGKGIPWLDATAGVAPFGLLETIIRDKQALVIPENSPARLMTTPENPPFPSDQHLAVKGQLAADGTFTGHFDWTAHGDFETLLRAIFEQVAPVKWPELVQNIVHGGGFAGTISNLDVANPRDLDKPIQYSYDYSRPTYSDWPNRRISPPLPPILLAPDDSVKKPEEPYFLGAVGTITYEASLRLPPKYMVVLPGNTVIHRDFANYSASYTVQGNTLVVKRQLEIKRAKLPVDRWDEYRAFAKEVVRDHDDLLQLSASDEPNGSLDNTAGNNPEAAGLIQQAIQSARSGDRSAARHLLARAERLNPKQRDLWTGYAALYFAENQKESGFESIQKEIRFHPDNIVALGVLASAQKFYHRDADAIDTLRSLHKLAPDDPAVTKSLAQELVKKSKYDEVLSLLAPSAATGKDAELLAFLGEAQLFTGHKQEGEATLQKFVADGNAMALNNAAYWMAETRTDLPRAAKYGTKAVEELEKKSSAIQLAELTNDDLSLMNLIAAAWDTLGWTDFQNGDAVGAEKYLKAAWSLSQRAPVADHLSQVYEKQKDVPAAIHMLQLELACGRNLSEVREHLEKLKASLRGSMQTVSRTAALVQPGEELGKLRTVNVSALPKQEASAEFFVLLNGTRAEEAEFISGSETLKSAATALKAANFPTELPDSNATKLVRRGILSCSIYTRPSCQFVMLLPESTRR